MAKARGSSKKVVRELSTACAYITSTFNNTIISITDNQGNLVCWSSSGVVGFKGARKSTPYAAQIAVRDVAEKAKNHGITNLSIVKMNGLGQGREAALRALQVSGFNIASIQDVTPLPHNGCRPPKRRRV